jgi:hypothetical protein
VDFISVTCNGKLSVEQHWAGFISKSCSGEQMSDVRRWIADRLSEQEGLHITVSQHLDAAFVFSRHGRAPSGYQEELDLAAEQEALEFLAMWGILRATAQSARYVDDSVPRTLKEESM